MLHNDLGVRVPLKATFNSSHWGFPLYRVYHLIKEQGKSYQTDVFLPMCAVDLRI